MTRDDAYTLVWLALVLITAPLWIIPGVIYMIATGNTPRTMGEKANQLSEVDE